MFCLLLIHSQMYVCMYVYVCVCVWKSTKEIQNRKFLKKKNLPEIQNSSYKCIHKWTFPPLSKPNVQRWHNISSDCTTSLSGSYSPFFLQNLGKIKLYYSLSRLHYYYYYYYHHYNNRPNLIPFSCWRWLPFLASRVSPG